MAPIACDRVAAPVSLFLYRTPPVHIMTLRVSSWRHHVKKQLNCLFFRVLLLWLETLCHFMHLLEKNRCERTVI